jgi:hypothetical protein
MISTDENRSYSTFDEDDDESSIVMYNHSKLYLSSGNHSHNSHSHQSWDKTPNVKIGLGRGLV